MTSVQLAAHLSRDEARSLTDEVKGDAERLWRKLVELYEGGATKKLAKFPGGPAALLGRAKSQKDIKGGTVARNVAAIIVDLYNKGRRSGQLPPL